MPEPLGIPDEETLAELDDFKFHMGIACALDPDGAARAHRVLRAAVRAQRDEIEQLTTERDAYKRAKAENDDRFMLERDEARIERDHLAAEVERLNVEIKGWRQLNDSLLRHLADARAVITRVRERAQDIADHGLRADLTPTVMFGDESHVYRQLTDYLRRLDESTRERARSLLALLPTQDSGEDEKP